MAGTITFTIVSRFSYGNLRGRIVDVNASSVPTTGATFNPGDVELISILFARGASTQYGYDFTYDYTNNKLLAWMYNYTAANGPAIAFTNNGDSGTSRWTIFGY